ncbi:uridine kinase family protein [Kineococcus xinjiangensis]|nr:hypothetical protein [Kineococcus xinjiangensis]
MTLPVEEPAAGPWKAAPEGELVQLLLQAAGTPTGRPRVVAVDGRGASGKSTLAERLCQRVGRSTVVHTDDIAWHEPYFAWGHLLAEHVLRPLHRGEAVSFRPPAWEQHGRQGSIDVPAGRDLVVIEGVGASQRELAELIDATVWVQSDFAAAEERGIARDITQGVNGDAEETIAFWHEWMAEELRFLERQRPWERACVVIAGTPPILLDEDHVALAPGPL